MGLNPLKPEQIKQLESQGCTAEDWSKVTAADGFDASRVRQAHFLGSVALGDNTGTLEIDGAKRPCGIYNATVADCNVGKNVVIANVGGHLANLNIEEGAAIQNVALIAAEPGAACGNGVEAEALNEAGGRELKLFNGLNSQIAFLHSTYRHNEKFIENLEKMIDAEIENVKKDKVTIGKGAKITNCGPLRNVAVGPAAVIDGAASLEDGTVNSCEEHPTKVGAGVNAEAFIISEGATVDSGALLGNSFVGQGTKMGKQYSAENSVYFANCEAFHGEGCAIFAGPYSVSHHKSTLMIASMFSFYNAGSGTNQSNHMYKLGPVHQGVFERGSKTGSFSYCLLDGHVGAFSVVIGKHMSHFELQDMPFSYIIESGGKSLLIPGLNMTTIGTIRDGEKWPNRDKRKMSNKRDLIIFDVYSPYTIEKMRRGRDILLDLNKSSSAQARPPRIITEIDFGGVTILRLRMERAANLYKQGIDRYLYGKVLDKLVEAIDAGKSQEEALASLKAAGSLKEPQAWTDLSGLLAARERVKALEAEVADGKVADVAAFEAKLKEIYDGYADDEWEYVYSAFTSEYGKSPDKLNGEDLKAAIQGWTNASKSLYEKILIDSKKEFDETARISYGLDQEAEEKIKDFEAVRGTEDTNKVVKKIEAELEAIDQRSAELREKLA